jgi:ubiquinone/menaquinone biosynthesis C-methylase UbiE
MTFKDLFSGHAQDYAKFRPLYPRALFEYLAQLSPRRERVWDCGTGNGQAALALADFFQEVIATDPSDKQLAAAAARPNVRYIRCSAEKSELASSSADLITVAQAFHWFKHAEFFEEVKRVARPDAHLAIWSYDLCKVSPEFDEAIRVLYEVTLGDRYWEPERKHVQEGYRSILIPFQELPERPFAMSADWSFEQLIGYFGTWSALQKYIQQNGSNPLEAMREKLKSAWGEVERRQIIWPLSVRVFRLLHQ